MKAFIITSLVMSGIGITCRFCALSWSDYPRQVKYTRGEDVFITVVTLAWAGWASWLLIR